jgi:hypothetical protein
MGRTREFDYEALDFEEIGKLYAAGVGWRGIARRFGAPDHKTLARHALRRLPDLEPRDHAQAQRARRWLEKRTAVGGW